ncbi:MAG TPA: cytochrome c biogenesis protein CcdA [Candidatus Binataceae bacterium]|nr:cytochrome c biogenesis protein CcdA [Candidatus Binataceae bacterium]
MKIRYRRLIEVSLNAIAAILIATLASTTALAQSPKPNELVKIVDAKIEPGLKAGGASSLKVDAQVIDGWHINSSKPFSDDYIPTKMDVNAPVSITVGAVNYPPAQTLTLEFAPDDKLSVYSGKIAFDAPLKIDGDFAPKPGDKVVVTIDYQGCNNTQCLRPASVTKTIDISPAPAAGGMTSAAGGSGAMFGGGRSDSEPGSIERIFISHGWIVGFLAVLLGGLALNLTPCVYPLIGVTIAYFGNQGGGPRRVLILAITYVLGIALMFSTVGVAVAMSGGLFGAALQNPWVLSGIAAMLVMLAGSSFGFFTIQPPQWLMQRAGTARPGYAGALLMGLGMGVIAAPCIGPIVLGLLLMVERSADPLFGFALFFTLAVGLGLPYIALAMAAGSIRRLPRSGEWLAWIEQLFGFILLGLALYFLDPISPNHLMTRILPFYAAGVGIYLGFITRHGRNWQPFLVLRSTLGIASAAALVWLLIPRAAPPALKFEPYDAQVLATAAVQKKPVLIDFSADWCIPCREMEHSTFVDPGVVSEASRFIKLRANLTAQDKINDDLTHQYDIQGVPTTLLIDSSGKVSNRKVGYIGPKEFLADLRHVD